MNAPLWPEKVLRLLPTNSNPPSPMKSPLRNLPRLASTLLAAGWLTALTPSLLAQPAISTEFWNYRVGEAVRLSFTNTPGGSTDWVGLYRPGQVPGPTPSTKWLYAGAGRTNGILTFSAFNTSQVGDWVGYFFLNDGYTTIATNTFRVADPFDPLVRPTQSLFFLGSPVSVLFTNGWGTDKDWVGIYRATQPPGAGTPVLRLYVDGTATGANSAGITSGTLNFPAGLSLPGDYLAALHYMDTTNALMVEKFSVAPVPARPAVVSVTPANGTTGQAPDVTYVAMLTNGMARVNTNTIALRLNGMLVPCSVVVSNALTWVSYTPATLYPSLSVQSLQLTFADDGNPVQTFTNTSSFTVVRYQNLALPAPLFFENFNATAEGELPAGWTTFSPTPGPDASVDFQNLNSDAFTRWLVIERDRFTNAFLSYNTLTPTMNYQRVLSANPANVVNGQVVRDLAQGRFLFADSGYRDGGNQVLFAYSPSYNLSGQANIWLVFHSLYEQNQDSFGALEYSVNGGATWLPIAYLLNSGDLVRDTNGVINAEATFTNVYTDVATYLDPDTFETRGGYYGAFIGVASNLWPTLGYYLSPRVDDNAVESKRIETYRLRAADGQANVKFRFAYAGTDSWYWGVDNFGLYSIPTNPLQVSISLNGADKVIHWTGGAGPFQVERATSLAPANWAPVGNPVSVGPVVDTAANEAAYYRVIGR